MRILDGVALALCLWPAVLFGASTGADPAAHFEIPDVTVVIRSEPYNGTLLRPATDEGFHFRLNETKDRMFFRWSSLEAAERRRVQKLLGVEVHEEGRLVFGKELECVRLHLKSGKSVEGCEVPERAYLGYRCLKNATQVVQIPKAEVLKEEKLTKRESEIYAATDIYDRLMLERPPGLDSARDQLEFSRRCGEMGLYDRAIDHLRMAEAVDPRVKETSKEYYEELLNKHADKEAEKLYLSLLRDYYGGSYERALDKIELLKSNFPNSPYYTKVDGLSPQIEKEYLADFSKNVIRMYYTLTLDLIREQLSKRVPVDAKGRMLPTLPGKLVTTTKNHIFRGKLLAETADTLTLQDGEMRVDIPKKYIMTLRDVDLSAQGAARMEGPTFAYMKRYVTDKNGGLGKDLLKRIAQALRSKEERVKDAWEGRFNRTAKYDGTQVVKTPIYTTLHTADYGPGAWLRDGSGVPEPEGNTFADNSDDPEVWWRAQPSGVREQVLKAFAAEALFRVKSQFGDTCSQCGGRGVMEIFNTQGSTAYTRCPACRGRGAARVINYE
ncbi:MAG: zinc finger-like domain-containing protein [Planctomycetota bacterium]|nr:zinc finger-like domain-containing protein [Planctomycetota bacterium]